MWCADAAPASVRANNVLSRRAHRSATYHQPDKPLLHVPPNTAHCRREPLETSHSARWHGACKDLTKWHEQDRYHARIGYEDHWPVA